MKQPKRASLTHMFQSAESAYNQWVRDHYRFVLRSAWALTGSRAVAEDVVQDCFASAWKHKGQLRDAALVRPWLFKIMRRSAFRHAAPAPVAPGEIDEAAGAAEEAGINDRLDVVKALAKIAPIHREVLVLYYFDDMPTVRMAEALEIAPGTVLSRLARARDALKAVMEPPARAAAGSVATAAPRSNVTPLQRP
jgi:RNA polymerase sigma factor (sigma-70 family)